MSDAGAISVTTASAVKDAPASTSDAIPVVEENIVDVEETPMLDKKALSILLVQHFSNSWGLRTAEFAVYIFLVTLFPDTLLPASIFGFLTTGTSTVLSGWAGHQVDVRHNLRLVRTCIIIIKFAACGAYAASLILLYRLGSFSARPWSSPLAGGMFAVIVICGCVHTLAGVAISVAIERDWVTVISGGSSSHLTTINTHMRRIDLLCKLLAPLFVSLLTAAASYKFAAYFLCGVEIVCMAFELPWIAIVYRRFPALIDAQKSKESSAQQRREEHRTTERHPAVLLSSLRIRLGAGIKRTVIDWKEFSHQPIFLSSLAISCLYLTVLSFDGTMLSYLKSETYSDPFLAGMRGLNVVAGLAGTLAMPVMERKLGLVRAGNWSIWSEVLCLLPVVIAFYVGAPQEGNRAPAWNAALLFGGMMLSRVGLWAFDLCQLKELQIALAEHPRRNSLCGSSHRTGLQYSLQSVADMIKYILTMVLSRPSQFKYAALTSFGVLYTTTDARMLSLSCYRIVPSDFPQFSLVYHMAAGHNDGTGGLTCTALLWSDMRLLPPSSAAALDPSLLSVSIEFFAFPGYTEIPATNNCLANIASLRGAQPAIRIGGTTQDRATYDASLTSPMKGSVTVGLNRQLNNESNSLAAATQAKKGMSNLFAIELGNEPDLYSGSSPIASGTGWSQTIDATSEKNWFSVFAPTIGNIFQGAVYLSWSTQPLLSGLGSALSAVKSISRHSYPQSACGGASTNLTSLMSHSGIVSYTSQYKSEATAAHAAGKKFFFGETNSATCGGGGISPTFGAGLWILDYVIQGALNGADRLYFHHGTIGNCAYCWWGQDAVYSPYYGAAFLSEFIGTDGVKVAMLDDGTSAIAVYAVYSSSNVPVRLLVINTNYFDGTGTRSTASVSLTGLSTASGTKQTKRLTAPSATSRVDEGAAVTIGGGGMFDNNCLKTGKESTETVSVSENAMSVSVQASEALIVFL
ncbi:Solute carrier family 40 member 2 [Grifola frondosa]|uniref:Solute carrier family 40 member 2 n=1 Tax=Grifola frondosa TaxID=5627 RepID=A0A1C7LQS9_GRIFR|nr:Solute carrier family 40 member 2 [Grifola frondosa]